MKRTVTLSLLAIALVGLSLPIIGPFFIFPAVVPVLAPLLPRPKYVPEDATATYEWKASGMHWQWRRSLKLGSAAWSATDSYAGVTLSLDDNSIRYLTFEDAVVFQTGTPIAGRAAPSGGGRSCQFGVSSAELARFGQLVSEALAQAGTAGEIAILQRIARRLSDTDGTNLTSYMSGWGCSDLTLEDYKRPRPQPRFDPLKTSD